jgi:drug/metabolite transporter superfamily protein YnfA
MRPFTVLIGIILGSAASISFGLGAVLIVFAILGGKHPDLLHELPRLLASFGAFSLLTAASAGSFLGQAKTRPWRGWAHLGTAVCLCGVVLLYWPRRS